MAITIKKNHTPFEPKKMPHIEDFPEAKPVSFSSKKTTPSGERIEGSEILPEVKQTKEEVNAIVQKAIDNGLVKPKQPGERTDTSDPEFREAFGKLLYMGASRQMVCQILGISTDTYRRVKRQHLEGVVESLAETGVMGMVALGFDKLEFASNRTMQLIASLGEKESDRSDLLNAVRTLKDIESEKINLLVKTGAIKRKKTAELSAHMEVITGGSKPLLTGEKAQGIMVKILGNIVEAADGAEEVDFDGNQETDQ